MKKTIFEQIGVEYTRQGDYLLPNLTLPEKEERPIGVWGQRRLRYLKQHHKILYYNLLTSGKLHSHLADVEKEAQLLFLRLVKEYSEEKGIMQLGAVPAGRSAGRHRGVHQGEQRVHGQYRVDGE